MARAEGGKRRRRAARALAAKQLERSLQVWARVHPAGERRIDIARAYGYKAPSASIPASAAMTFPPRLLTGLDFPTR